MDVFKGDKLILTKEYGNLAIGATYELANITDSKFILRELTTKLAVAAIEFDKLEEYFVKPEEFKGWTKWGVIANEYGNLIGMYRTNGKKVQVRMYSDSACIAKSEATCCKDDKFNLMFGINLAYLRCIEKMHKKNKEKYEKILKETTERLSDTQMIMKRMLASLDKEANK